MVVPEEREGKTEAAMSLSRDVTKATDVIDTRKAGGRQANETRRVGYSSNQRFSLTATLMRFYVVLYLQGNRKQSAHYQKQYRKMHVLVWTGSNQLNSTNCSGRRTPS